MPPAIENAVQRANADPHIHVMELAGTGKAFCQGQDLVHDAAGDSTNKVAQEIRWYLVQDYLFMRCSTQHFMSL